MTLGVNKGCNSCITFNDVDRTLKMKVVMHVKVVTLVDLMRMKAVTVITLGLIYKAILCRTMLHSYKVGEHGNYSDFMP